MSKTNSTTAKTVRRSQARAAVRVQPLVMPLRWRNHHIRGNGCFGETVTGAEIVYIYQPGKHLRRRAPWAIFQYWGANTDRCKHFGEISDQKTGKPQRHKTIAGAKRAAQQYWRREVVALLRHNGRDQ